MNIVTDSRFSKNIFESLISQLQQFGLDPKDWKLVAHKGKAARLVHRQDAAFRFIGSIDPRKGVWKNLYLESL